jgi:capsular exopolysaccharide synthesis family protein
MFAERFRELRTSIIYSNPDLSKKVLLISSVGPAEGKSTVAVNLATAFSQSEGKTILIDADLRKPTLHSIFKVPCEKGLTELLVSQNPDYKTFLKNTGIKNLDFISCGTIPLNPAELLGSKKLEQLINELSKSYDRIIFDAPPILAATDAVILSTKVDATILVFKAGFTHKQAAIRASKLIHSVHSKVLGIVLNMVKAEDYKYYPYYNYYSQNVDKAQS